MREIKFRDWNPESKKMRYYDLDGYDRYNDDQYGTIEQFTGLHDKNGVEIYEGDIVKFKWLHDTITAVVKWSEKRCMFYYGAHQFNNAKHLEVIGNIHENPSTIKRGES